MLRKFGQPNLRSFEDDTKIEESLKNKSQNNISENKTKNVKSPAETRDAKESNSLKESQFGQGHLVDISIFILICQFGS